MAGMMIVENRKFGACASRYFYNVGSNGLKSSVLFLLSAKFLDIPIYIRLDNLGLYLDIAPVLTVPRLIATLQWTKKNIAMPDMLFLRYDLRTKAYSSEKASVQTHKRV